MFFFYPEEAVRVYFLRGQTGLLQVMRVCPLGFSCVPPLRGKRIMLHKLVYASGTGMVILERRNPMKNMRVCCPGCEPEKFMACPVYRLRGLLSAMRVTI